MRRRRRRRTAPATAWRQGLQNGEERRKAGTDLNDDASSTVNLLRVSRVASCRPDGVLYGSDINCLNLMWPIRFLLAPFPLVGLTRPCRRAPRAATAADARLSPPRNSRSWVPSPLAARPRSAAAMRCRYAAPPHLRPAASGRLSHLRLRPLARAPSAAVIATAAAAFFTSSAAASIAVVAGGRYPILSPLPPPLSIIAVAIAVVSGRCVSSLRIPGIAVAVATASSVVPFPFGLFFPQSVALMAIFTRRPCSRAWTSMR